MSRLVDKLYSASNTIPLWALALGCVAVCTLAPPRAAAETSVATIVIADDDVPLGDATEVHMGLRRGLRSVEGLEYVFQGDLLDQREVPDALFDAIEALPRLEQQIREMPAQRPRRRAARPPIDDELQQILSLFEANLHSVSKANLATAYMLAALLDCRLGARRRCQQGFEYVLVFRDSFIYDETRFPEEYNTLFEDTRSGLLEQSALGAVEIRTEPPGAEVFVDGRSFGPSPVRVEALAGEHYVTVKTPGYLEQVSRVSFPAETSGGASSVDLALEESPSALLVRQNLPRILRELGEPTGGSAIRSIDGYLPVNQIVIGVMSAHGSLALYLYDLRTNFLLATRDASVGDPGMIASNAERLTSELYEDAPLDGRVDAPEHLASGDSGEIWEQWWFWTAVGVVVVSGTATAIALSPSDPEVPTGSIRIPGTIR